MSKFNRDNSTKLLIAFFLALILVPPTIWCVKVDLQRAKDLETCAKYYPKADQVFRNGSTLRCIVNTQWNTTAYSIPRSRQ